MENFVSENAKEKPNDKKLEKQRTAFEVRVSREYSAEQLSDNIGTQRDLMIIDERNLSRLSNSMATQKDLMTTDKSNLPEPLSIEQQKETVDASMVKKL